MKPTGWEQLTNNFPDHSVITAILGICEYGARMGYEGQRATITIYLNLAISQAESDLVTPDIAFECNKKRLKIYPNFLLYPKPYTASPLGLVDKSDSGKRSIHHVSYPVGDPSAIKHGIPEPYGAIAVEILL